MALLPETNLAIADWASSREEQLGMHLGPEIKAGVYGQVVGETRLDPVRHFGLRPNAFSLLGMITGEDYVELSMPEHPLDVSVVVHHDPAERDLPPYLQPMAGLKKALSAELYSSVVESLPGIGDNARLYVVGEADNDELLEQGAEVLDNTEDPRLAAEAVAEICTRGLTFVISDFNRLPLEAVADADFDNSVAIKANHHYELEPPANVGPWSLGGLKQIDTDKPKELAKGRAYLAEIHAAREQRIHRAGLVLARVVFTKGYQNGFNFPSADEAIAAAITEINQA